MLVVSINSTANSLPNSMSFETLLHYFKISSSFVDNLMFLFMFLSLNQPLILVIEF